MTRFARAKGSKASNERVPNDATPWHVMKENLQENVIAKNAPSSKAKSAKQLLSEKDEPYYCDTTGNVNHEWAEFDEADRKSEKKGKKPTNDEETKKSKKNKKKHVAVGNGSDETRRKVCEKNGESKVCLNTNKNIQSSKDCKSEAVLYATPNENGKKVIEHDPKPKMSKKKRNGEKVIPAVTDADKTFQIKEEETNTKLTAAEKNEKDAESTGKISKRQKRNRKRIDKIASEKAAAGKVDGTAVGFDVSGNDWSSDVRFGKRADRPASSRGRAAVGGLGPKSREPLKRKAPKIRDDKEHKRRKPESGSIKCTINGMEIEIVKYDGFPVKREDAERLRDLRQEMKMKGIPKSEIDAAMKLERRKAEKALARVRKQVCFHCRKAGHNLSDCPELGKEECATGICFKCGSTEHTHFECRVTKKEEFRFASCFICREQGHIAKQCPDNPKGLYPQGGACKICGDVTHLKKDCPDLTREKEETGITLGTIAENNVESLDDNSMATSVAKDVGNRSKSKIVQF